MVEHQVGTGHCPLVPWFPGKLVPGSCLRGMGLSLRVIVNNVVSLTHAHTDSPHSYSLLRKAAKWLRKDWSLLDESFSFIYSYISLSHFSYLVWFFVLVEEGRMPNNAMHVSRLTFFLHGILKVSLRYYPICSQNTFMRIYYQYYLILQIIPVFFFLFSL